MNFIYNLELEKKIEIDLYSLKEKLAEKYSVSSIEKNIDEHKIKEYIQNYNYDKASFCKSLETKYNIKIEEIRDNKLFVNLSGIIPNNISFSNLTEKEQNHYIDIISESWNQVIFPELKHKVFSFPSFSEDYLINKIEEDFILSIEEPEYEQGFEF